MPTATVTSNGRVTLPKAIRDLLRVRAGDQIDFVITARGDVIVRRASLQITELRGLLERPRRRAATVEMMNSAIARQHSRKR